MIKAEALIKSFGPHLAVDGVSFEVKSGEVLGFLGPNGAGKSTTMRMLTGYLTPSAGKIVINGHDMDEDPIAAKASIGYLPENAPLYSDMTVGDFLTFAAQIRGLTGSACRQAVEHAVEICQLENVYHQSIDTLSKGYRHRTCFAQAILRNPDVLILDEPTDGLDPNQKHQMRELIAELGKSKAIIVSTHILEEVEAICTRVIIIDCGHVVFNGTPAELREKSPEAGAVTVRCDVDVADLRSAVCALAGAPQVRENGDGTFTILPQKPEEKASLLSKVKKVFVDKQWDFSELFVEKGRLDEVFRIITSNETAEVKK